MVAEPRFDFEGKEVLKHAWFPVRERWYVPTVSLVFKKEQAYRFAKRIIDGNAAITFATTTDSGFTKKGYMMADEMEIMKVINDRFMSNSVPDYETYVRPEEATLVGE